MKILQALRRLVAAGGVAFLVIAAPVSAQNLPPDRRPTDQGPKVPDRGATLDTSKVLYLRQEGERFYLRSMNADGSGDAEFWGERIACSSYAVSPDGRTLYYSDRDGTYSKTMGAERRKLFDAQAYDLDVSADGARLAYSRTTADAGRDIYVSNVDGTGERRLTDAPRNDLTPSWSPDGRTILYSESLYTWLMTMAPDGTGKRALSEDVGPRVRFVQASYSPDGTRIVAKGIQDSSTQIYIMNADGSSPRALTSRPGQHVSPHWSPDGSRVVAGYQPPDTSEPWQLILIAVKGGAITRLPTAAPYPVSQPRWLRSSVRVTR